jgi:peptidoglycan/LPS O-acetylase OafA/YrhL
MREVAKLKNLQRLYSLAAVCAGGAIALLVFIVTGSAAVLHFVAFPALGAIPWRRPRAFLGAGKRLRLVGDISYSTYLLHFPFQLYIIIIAATLGVGIDFNQPIVFLSFVVLLLVLSIITFYWLERPAQEILRKKMLGRS